VLEPPLLSAPPGALNKPPAEPEQPLNDEPSAPAISAGHQIEKRSLMSGAAIVPEN
jgi:hypothetical protein